MFAKSSKTAKCKTQLKLVVSRIKILRNKREIQLKHLRRNVAQLLQNKQEGIARTRVEHAIREQNMLAAYDIIDGYCEFLSARIQSLSGQRECPAELKEAIACLIYAGPRCADLPELLEIRSIITAKFGKQFIATIVELRVGCGVSNRIIEKLSTQPLTTDARLKFMAEVCKEHKVKWEPEDLSLSAGEVKQQQAPETAPPATAKPRPSVVTEPGNVNNSKNAPPEDFSSPKSPLASVRSNGTGYDANSELDDDSDEDQGKPETPSPVPRPKPSEAPRQQRQQPQQQQRQQQQQQQQQQQFIPFAGAPSRPPAEDPYGQYHNRGITNPYVQKPAAAKPESVTTPADAYAEYRKKFMGNSPSFADVATAAEAAAESADHAAAAARAAASLAHKQLSRESSMVDGESVPSPVPRPLRKSSAVNLDERVASYLQTHADDAESSEWDSPMPKEEHYRLNPSRNLYAEQQRVQRDEMTRRSTGSNVTGASERVPGHNGEKRMSLGAARANQEEYKLLSQREAARAKHEELLQREAAARAARAKQEELLQREATKHDELLQLAASRLRHEEREAARAKQEELSQREAARARQEEYTGLFQREASRAKQEDYNDLFQREEVSPRSSKPVFDEEVSKPSPNADVYTTSTRRPAYDGDYGTRPSRWEYETRKELHEETLPVFDDPAPSADTPPTAAAFGRADTFVVHLESMNENILSKTEKLFEKEDSDASPEIPGRRKSTRFGGRVMLHRAGKEESESSSDAEELSLNARKPSTGGPRFDTEPKLPSPKTQPAEPTEHDNKTKEQVERTSWTGPSRPPARPPPPLMNVNTSRFHGSAVDYAETSSLKKPYRLVGASVRTKR